MSAPTRYALVIGNANYRAVPPLANPGHDARSMSVVLGRLGFAVELLLDADRSQMQSALVRLAQNATGAEAALFYYAGHAAEADGRNLLFPVNVSARSSTMLLRDALAFDEVTRALGGRARTTLMFLDACRDNPLVAGIAARGLAPVRSGAGTLIAFATAPGETALDGAGEHSPFTDALLRHLETPDLEVRGMLTRVRNTVRTRTGGQQTPWDNSSLEFGFYFALSQDRSGLARQPTQRTFDEAARLGIPLPPFAAGFIFVRDEGVGSSMVGSWSSGERRFGGAGRYSLLLVMRLDRGAGTANVFYGYGPPTPAANSQDPAGGFGRLASADATSLRFTNTSGDEFLFALNGPNEGRLSVRRGNRSAVVIMRRLE